MRVLAFVLLAASAGAQATWTSLSPAASPAPREDQNLVFDPATQRVYLFFGRNGLLVPPSFWMWDGASWQVAATTMTGGFALTHGVGGLCADGLGGMLMFGGYFPGIGIGGGTPSVNNQTWRILVSTGPTLDFTMLTPPVAPAARQAPGMVLTNQGVVLFGGANATATNVFADTWRWNGTTWTNVSPPGSPPARCHCAMAFDAARNVVVMFGGINGSGITSNDTWEFDGTTWQQRFPAHQPSPRCRASCCWLPAIAGTVLFGGGSANGSGHLGDAWLWNGVDWHAVPQGNAPAPRQGAGFVYDGLQQRPLLFGGRGSSLLGDTWYLDIAASPASYTPFGAGCVGPTAMVPALAPLAGEVPAVGTTTHLRVANLPIALTLPVFVLGFSNTFEANPGYALPFDLGFLGWPGCLQLVSHDVMNAVPTLTGEATVPFVVPFAAGLTGVSFHAQALVLYQPTGAAVSNGLTGVVGF